MNQKLAYTVREAAQLLSISRSLLYEMIQSGRIQSVKIGRSRRITNEHIRDFLEVSEAPESIGAQLHKRG